MPPYRRHTYTWLKAHIVFGTKYRSDLIPSAMKADLFQILATLVGQQRGELIDVGGMPDHIHLLVGLHRGVPLADLLRSLKKKSTQWMNERGRPDLPFAWQRGYGAFSVSLSQMPVVREYIQRQQEHHRRLSFADEIRQLLADHSAMVRDAV